MIYYNLAEYIFTNVYNFINYIDKISKGSDDIGSAKLIRRK